MNKTESPFTLDQAKTHTKKVAQISSAILATLEATEGTHDQLVQGIESARNAVYWQREENFRAQSEAEKSQYVGKFGNNQCVEVPSIRRNY